MDCEYVVLVLGENTFPWHRIEETASAFRGALDGRWTVTLTTDRDELAALESVDVVVDYLTNSTLTTAQLLGLSSFIENGGGYVGVHCAGDLTSISWSEGDVLSRPEPHAELRQLLGGHAVTHLDTAKLTVSTVSDHPVTTDVDRFTLVDSPYRLEWDDDVTIHARMDHPELAEYPVMWTNAVGDGRICYLSLGHTAEALTNTAVRTLLRNAVRWAGQDD